MKSLKKLVLSHNRFTVKTVRYINRLVKSDSYLRSLDFRGNDMDIEAIEELYDALKDNDSIFNLDLR